MKFIFVTLSFLKTLGGNFTAQQPPLVDSEGQKLELECNRSSGSGF